VTSSSPVARAADERAPTLSVCMPNFNHAAYLKDALDALFAQSYAPLEIIVLDDASTDDSLEILNDYSRRQPSLRVERNPVNLGVLPTVTRLFEMATGDYLFGMAADDRILPGMFERSMSLLAEHRGAGMCSGLSRIIDEDGRDRGLFPSRVVSAIPTYFPPDRARELLPRGTNGWYVMGNTAIYKRSAVFAAGGLLPELEYFSDSFMSRVIALRHGACFVPEPLGAVRLLTTSYSAALSREIERRRRLIERSADLMAARYFDTFPAAYTSAWRRRALIDEELLDLAARRRERLETLARRPWAGTAGARLVLATLRLAGRLEYFLTELRWVQAAGLPVRTLVEERVERRRDNRRREHHLAAGGERCEPSS
jgi:glycosyltransferase involved in cell wall biosynthesis